MLNAGSCIRFSSCGWVKFCMAFGCVMLCKDGDNFGALPLEAARAWALGKSWRTPKLLERFKCEFENENNKRKNKLKYIP